MRLSMLRTIEAVRPFIPKMQMLTMATGLRGGSCPGWEVDHVVALCAGGADKRANMQWLTVQDHREKTRHDRRICRAIKKQ